MPDETSKKRDEHFKLIIKVKSDIFGAITGSRTLKKNYI